MVRILKFPKMYLTSYKVSKIILNILFWKTLHTKMQKKALNFDVPIIHLQ